MRKYFMLAALFFHTLFCLAQVAVSKEPRHHNVFENEYVRVLDVHIPPGDTSLFHKHATPSVFIVLNPVKTGSEVIMEEAKATALTRDAAISFEGFYTTPRVHRVWNEDTAEFHVMDIELLNKAPHNIGAPIERENFKLLFDEKPVRGYRFMLDKESTVQLPAHTSFLIIGLTDASPGVSINRKSFSRKGDYLFITADDAAGFTNKSQQPYSFAVLELK